MPLAERYRLGYANLEATTRLRQRQRAGIAAGTEAATQRKEKGKTVRQIRAANGGIIGKNA